MFMFTKPNPLKTKLVRIQLTRQVNAIKNEKKCQKQQNLNNDVKRTY